MTDNTQHPLDNTQYPLMKGRTNSNERLTSYNYEKRHAETMSDENMQLRGLIATGFEWREAIKLLDLREHLHENVEVRQRVADDYRMQFVRWLYEHGEIGEE